VNDPMLDLVIPISLGAICGLIVSAGALCAQAWLNRRRKRHSASPGPVKAQDTGLTVQNQRASGGLPRAFAGHMRIARQCCCSSPDCRANGCQIREDGT